MCGCDGSVDKVRLVFLNVCGCVGNDDSVVVIGGS